MIHANLGTGISNSLGWTRYFHDKLACNAGLLHVLLELLASNDFSVVVYQYCVLIQFS